MRQILISKRGEFSFDSKVDVFRGFAVKMLANLIQTSPDRQGDEDKVVVSDANPTSLDKSKAK